MEHHTTITIEFMVKSHYELARIIEAERHTAAHTSGIVGTIANRPGEFGDAESAMELSLEAKQSVAAYLSSLGDLEEAIADNLEIILTEMRDGEGSE